MFWQDDLYLNPVRQRSGYVINFVAAKIIRGGHDFVASIDCKGYGPTRVFASRAEAESWIERWWQDEMKSA